MKRLQIYNGHMQRPFPNGHKCPFGCNGYVTAVAVGKSRRLYLYSGVGIFNWYYLSSPTQIPRRRGVPLETRGLTSATLIQVAPPGYFFMCFYNHAHRLRLEKLL